ncbi:MAG: CopG family transcriptional regulator [Bacteroidetes bacterium]|nr:CopG family transcriptional regulator [Bacteroidota bacterium]
MEQRIGAVVILVSGEGDINRINSIISDHADMILGRQGIPLRERTTNVISLVLEGDTDRMGSLTGKLGRLPGVKVKSVLAG